MRSFSSYNFHITDCLFVVLNYEINRFKLRYFSLNDFLTVFFHKKRISNQTGHCRKLGYGQQRAIICINLVDQESPKLNAKFQDHRTSNSVKVFFFSIDISDHF